MVHSEDVEKLCSYYGRVMDVYVIRDSAKNRASVYVKMSSNDEALKAIKGINGAIFEGFVLKAHPQKKSKKS